VRDWPRLGPSRPHRTLIAFPPRRPWPPRLFMISFLLHGRRDRDFALKPSKRIRAARVRGQDGSGQRDLQASLICGDWPRLPLHELATGTRHASPRAPRAWPTTGRGRDQAWFMCGSRMVLWLPMALQALERNGVDRRRRGKNSRGGGFSQWGGFFSLTGCDSSTIQKCPRQFPMITAREWIPRHGCHLSTDMALSEKLRYQSEWSWKWGVDGCPVPK